VREEEEGGRRVGPACQRRKEKKKEAGARTAAGGEGWAVGRLGQNEGELLSLFFFFFFSNSFKIEPFQLKFNQNFSNFFTKFNKPFKPHTSNQKPCIAK
jgi:hypothetical protein